MFNANGMLPQDDPNVNNKLQNQREKLIAIGQLDTVVNRQAVATMQAYLQSGANSNEYGIELQRLASIISHVKINKLLSVTDAGWRIELVRIKQQIAQQMEYNNIVDRYSDLYTSDDNGTLPTVYSHTSYGDDLQLYCVDKTQVQLLDQQLSALANGDGADIVNTAVISLMDSISRLEQTGVPLTDKALLDPLEYCPIRGQYYRKSGNVKPPEMWQRIVTNPVRIAAKAVADYIRSQRTVRDQGTLYAMIERIAYDNALGHNVFVRDYHRIPLVSADVDEHTGAVTEDQDVNDLLMAICQKADLTRRERRTIQLLADGKSADEIAEITSVNTRAVKYRISSARQKIIDSGAIDVSKINTSAINTANESQRIAAYKDNQLIGVYDSIGQASKALGVNKGNIVKVLQGKRKQANGYTFKEID